MNHDMQIHRDAFADTGDGYTHEAGVVQCLWCPFSVEAKTKRLAADAYAKHVRAVMGEEETGG